MTFGPASPEMESALRALWKRVFGDPDEYLDFFFSRCFSPLETMVAAENGIPYSMLYLLPMTVRENGKAYPARYVYAVGTDPLRRLQGLSGALLRETHRVLKERKIALSLLVPAEKSLFGYYAAKGYETAFFQRTLAREFSAGGETLPLQKTDLATQKPLRDRFFSDCALYGAYDEAGLWYRGGENEFLGGETLAFSCNGSPGYAVCTPRNGEVLVRELVGEADDLVLRSLARRFDCSRVRARLPGTLDDPPLAMSCWYTPHRASGGKTALSLVLD